MEIARLFLLFPMSLDSCDSEQCFLFQDALLVRFFSVDPNGFFISSGDLEVGGLVLWRTSRLDTEDMLAFSVLFLLLPAVLLPQ